MTVPTVCVLTAGKGARMGGYGQRLNKALLPIGGKATLSRIVEKFPAETEFIIGVGFLADQVRLYLRMAHPNRRITFVDVNNFDGPGSGPGHSLLCCRGHLQRPFYFVSCDTLWGDTLDWSDTDNWLGVSRVNPADTGRYCNLKVENGQIVALRDKVHVNDPAYQAFVGLCFIKDHEIFWSALESDEVVAGEHQVSNGLRALIEHANVKARPVDWTDVGDYEKYRDAVKRYEDYDFSKQDEALYSLGGRVVKFFADASIARNRVAKSRLNPAVFPPIVEAEGQFYAYEYQPGETLYERNTPELFGRFLEWLEANLWRPHTADKVVMRDLCLHFYRDKTFERLSMYYEKHGIRDRGSCVNGRSIPATNDLLARVPWARLAEGRPAFIHGDLQFDNVLHDRATESFTLLDWRQDFAGCVEFGDLYYDLAKLYGGIQLNYDYIKRNLLTYHEDESGIVFDFAQRYQTRAYLTVLTHFMEVKGFDVDRVRLLTGLVYLNMAPLHNDPFDRLLYSLGRLVLAETLEGGEAADRDAAGRR